MKRFPIVLALALMAGLAGASAALAAEAPPTIDIDRLLEDLRMEESGGNQDHVVGEELC